MLQSIDERRGPKTYCRRSRSSKPSERDNPGRQAFQKENARGLEEVRVTFGRLAPCEATICQRLTYHCWENMRIQDLHMLY